MLVTSDLHGNVTKLKMFLNFRKEENIEKAILGDFMDSFSASDEDLIYCLKSAVEAGCTILAGNHELAYLSNAHSYFRCSGNRENPSLYHAVNAYKDVMKASIVRDGYIMTHGGVSKKHGKPFDDINELNEWSNSEFEWYKNNPVVPETLSSIFDIGRMRGGREEVGGIFWASIGYEKLDNRFSQIVGHTPRPEPIIMEVGDFKRHVGVDTKQFVCYCTETHKFYDFMADEYKNNGHMRAMLERQF